MKQTSAEKQGQYVKKNEAAFDPSAPSFAPPILQFWMRRFYQPALRQITKPGKVLDIGCGTGEFLQELLRRVSDEKKGYTIYGADISSRMLTAARRKLGKIVHLQKADVHALPYPDDQFDYVVSTEAFHHYADQRKALAEMQRVAKKHGKVLIVDIDFFLRPIHWLFEKLEPGCVKINSRSQMQRIFREAGLQQITQHRSFLFAVLTIGVKAEC